MGESLETLNAIEMRKTIGGVIFVSILMAIGIMGNLHVLFAYAFKTNDSTRRTFILTLGTLDFIACVVGMPFIIVDLTNPLSFDLTSGCKILRFVNYFVCLSSVFILLVIAIDRYRKVCHPLAWQISRTTAKFICLGFILLSGTLSWPAAVLYGSSEIETSNPNVTGVSCLIQKHYVTTRYPFMFNALLLCIVIIVSMCLIVLYCLIGKTVNNFRSPNISIHHGNDSKSIETIQKHFGKPARESPCCSNDEPSTSRTSFEDNDIDMDNIDVKMAKYHVNNTLSNASREIGRTVNLIVRGKP